MLSQGKGVKCFFCYLIIIIFLSSFLPENTFEIRKTNVKLEIYLPLQIEQNLMKTLYIFRIYETLLFITHCL